MMIVDILFVILPVFLVGGGGYLSVRLKYTSDTTVDGLMSFALKVAVPALLFKAIAELDLNANFDPGLLLSFYVGCTSTFVLAIIASRRLFKRRPGEAVAIAFAALFSNSLLLGLPITQQAYGVEALAPNFAIISIHSPFCYLLGITTMEFARADGRSLPATFRAVISAMFKNSLMIGLFLGFIVNLGNVPVHHTIMDAADMLARAALPTALFALGGILTRYALKASLMEASVVTVLSLIVHPAITWLLATQAFHLPENFVRSAVITAAMAPGVNAYVFATLYSRGEAQSASAVLLATGMSVFSVTIWLIILGGV